MKHYIWKSSTGEKFDCYKGKVICSVCEKEYEIDTVDKKKFENPGRCFNCFNCFMSNRTAK